MQELKKSCLRLIAATVIAAIPGTPAIPQTHGGADELGRALPNGAYARSGLRVSSERHKKSYAGANKEPLRLLSLLPSMTILYHLSEITGTKPLRTRGVTHFGIPVEVRDSLINPRNFEDQPERDVVTHAPFDACVELDDAGACTVETQVGGGQSYTIVVERNRFVELFNESLGRRLLIANGRLKELETSGHLTIHKDRVNPRWTIVEGYASNLSTRCGQVIPGMTQISEDTAAPYTSDPATWAMDSPNWDLKALEVMNLGYVEKRCSDCPDSVGIVSEYGIGNDQDSDNTAIDLTVFAYRDSGWSEEFFKFAGLAQVVRCSNPTVGPPSPTYVDSVDLFFNLNNDEVPQDLPLLPPISLPNAYSDNAKHELFGILKRSFFYSINHQNDYEAIFGKLSERVPSPTAVANVIARLNASCPFAERDAEGCRQWSKPQFEQ